MSYRYFHIRKKNSLRDSEDMPNKVFVLKFHENLALLGAGVADTPFNSTDL